MRTEYQYSTLDVMQIHQCIMHIEQKEEKIEKKVSSLRKQHYNEEHIHKVIASNHQFPSPLIKNPVGSATALSQYSYCKGTVPCFLDIHRSSSQNMFQGHYRQEYPKSTVYERTQTMLCCYKLINTHLTNATVNKLFVYFFITQSL